MICVVVRRTGYHELKQLRVVCISLIPRPLYALFAHAHNYYKSPTRFVEEECGNYAGKWMCNKTS